jgi:hypothetical protein
VNLEYKTNIKYLGILNDKNLTWKHHIDAISTKISKGIGLIAKIRHFVPRNILINVYQSLIHPYLTYGIAVWGQACKTYSRFYETQFPHSKNCIAFYTTQNKSEKKYSCYDNAYMYLINS